MLNLITGKQRSGKSYFCVTLLIDYLRQCSRHIYTNLPVNPDILCDIACGGRLKYPVQYNQYLSRIHVFVNYAGRNRHSFKEFKRLNPDFCKMHHSFYSADYKRNLLIPVGRDNFMIRQFWRYTYSNAVIFLDEVYEIFGAIDQLSKGREIRKEMLSYAKQHGHFKDDLFLITHDPADIDKIIRKSLNKQYVVRNSKYQNIIENRLFKGLRWPVQFFMIKGYEYGEREAQDQFNIWPKQRVFQCYNSFNVSDFLDKDSASFESTSSDTAIDHAANWRNFGKQAFPAFLMLFGICVGFFVLIWGGFQFVSQSSSTSSVSSESESESVDHQQMSSDIADTSAPQTQVPFVAKTIKLVTPYKIIFSDDQTIIIGGTYRGYVVKKITPDYIILNRGSDYYRMSLSSFARCQVGEEYEEQSAGSGSSRGNRGQPIISTRGQGRRQ